MELQGDINEDVFKQNPGLLSFTYIDKLVRKTGRAKGSKVVWTAYQLEDINSPLYHRPREDRYKEVDSNYVKKSFKISEYKEFIDAWSSKMSSKEDILFKMWGDEIDAWTAQMNKLRMSVKSEREERLAIAVKLNSIVKQFQAASKEREKSKAKNLKIRGKGSLSKREERFQEAK